MFQKLIFVTLCIAFVGKTKAIIGGEDAGKNEFPWLVRFAVGERFCSGALLEMDLVLTSATCVQYYVDPVDIVAGDHSPLGDDGTEQTQISHYPILHEDFNKNGQLENDIALIRLFTPFTVTPYVRPIRLPVANPHLADAGRAVLAGWGETSVTSTDGNLRFFPGMSPILQKASLGYTNASVCAQYFDVQLPEGQFCTHGNGGAPMDKGGPLLCDDQPGQVCGVLSNVWLKHTENETTVGSYVQVNKYIDWISLNSLKATTTPSPTVAPTTPPSQGGGGSEGGSDNSGGIGTIIVKVENNTSTIMLILLIALCFIMIATSGVLMWKFISLKQEARLTESRIDLSRDFYRNSGAEAGNPPKGDYRV
ncbi:unnamed protein product [Orchesella dallaii]|uniref:Peptidase S1 domain-containing protein n=1 Tax=Orchesella dallaii TaxID=48710 RepID=A0ABP1RPQ6_9HEXA